MGFKGYVGYCNSLLDIFHYHAADFRSFVMGDAVMIWPFKRNKWHCVGIAFGYATFKGEVYAERFILLECESGKRKIKKMSNGSWISSLHIEKAEAFCKAWKHGGPLPPKKYMDSSYCGRS